MASARPTGRVCPRWGSDGDVAAALGDRSEAMGKHYTRHVKNETRVIRAFEGKKKP